MKIIIVSGGFDPIHSGHIAYFKSAKSHGDKLIVALNSDAWLEKKKGKFFMPFHERKSIVEAIKYVDEVISFEDDDKGSCINALEAIKKSYPDEEIYFANGGGITTKHLINGAADYTQFVVTVIVNSQSQIRIFVYLL